jgi:hypothetical protein
MVMSSGMSGGMAVPKPNGRTLVEMPCIAAGDGSAGMPRWEFFQIDRSKTLWRSSEVKASLEIVPSSTSWDWLSYIKKTQIETLTPFSFCKSKKVK